MNSKRIAVTENETTYFFTRGEINFSHFTTRHHINYAALAICLDWISSILTFFISLLLSGYAIINTLSFFALLLTAGSLSVIILFCISAYGYNPDRTAKNELMNVALGMSITAFIWSFMLFLIAPTTALFLWISMLIGLSLTIGWRFLVYNLAQWLFSKRWIRPRRIVMIGVSNTGNPILRSISKDKTGHSSIDSFVGTSLDNKGYEGLPMLATLTDNLYLSPVQHTVDDILPTLPQHEAHQQEEICGHLQHLPISILAPSGVVTPEIIRMFKAFKHLQAQQPCLTHRQLVIKRIFDVVFSLLAIILVLPLFLVIALAIKLDSKGPIFFKQDRVGENGRIFKILKFRSMCEEAESLVDHVKTVDENGRTIYKKPNDSRVTRVGKIIRKTSLDELPQLFNVLWDDMSIVGPRPEVVRVVRDEYEDWQYRRFSVPQGITGWWQVNGRSETPCYQSTDQDIYYIDNYSIGLDIKIILMTFPALLKGHGAF